MIETLEIKVNDTITIRDTLQDTIDYITSIVKEWYWSDSKEPLSITVKKNPPRGPPALGINVSDSVQAEGGLV